MLQGDADPVRHIQIDSCDPRNDISATDLSPFPQVFRVS